MDDKDRINILRETLEESSRLNEACRVLLTVLLDGRKLGEHTIEADLLLTDLKKFLTKFELLFVPEVINAEDNP